MHAYMLIYSFAVDKYCFDAIRQCKHLFNTTESGNIGNKKLIFQGVRLMYNT